MVKNKGSNTDTLESDLTRVKRKSFTKLRSALDIPHLLSVQVKSYERFLQANVPPHKRKLVGIERVLREIFPVEDVHKRFILEYLSYTLEQQKYSEEECKKKNLTYSVPLKAKMRLVIQDVAEDGTTKVKEARESWVYLGDIPAITENGTFIIRGSERVVVSQLHRSPGVFFDEKTLPTKKVIQSARIIPMKGSWLEVKFDSRNVIWLYIDARRKLPVTTFMRIIGGLSTTEIISKFHTIENLIPQKVSQIKDSIFVCDDIFSPQTGEILLYLGDKLTRDGIKKLVDSGVEKLSVIRLPKGSDIPPILSTLRADPSRSKEEALLEFHHLVRPGDSPTIETAQERFNQIFQNPSRYSLGEVGRYKMNHHLKLDIPPDTYYITIEDLLAVTRKLIDLKNGKGTTDDIDHLSFRRVRTVGELVENQFRVGIMRMARNIVERMRSYDSHRREEKKRGKETDTSEIGPQSFITTRTITGVLNTFFGSSQLSQFMDQCNPLAELTHKRRLSALGPGGLTRERAGFEVRDVHPTHYGRMCPIETPEGQNIGLITSLSLYARVNDFGFLETPYRKVKDGKVQDEIEYLTADKEEKHYIAQASTLVDENGEIINNYVVCRKEQEFLLVPKSEVNYIDISPYQVIGASAALIPFLEHDDANRALMGCNMQRQAVPLLFTEPAVVGTGLEKRIARDSGAILTAKRSGEVIYVDAGRIEIKPDPKSKLDLKALIENDEYQLAKFEKSNQNTTLNQRPLVRIGQHVKKGQILTDGPATSHGELALGKNLLVAFMPWHGYNFEDAIIISEKLVINDVLTSVHIEEFTLNVRETKLGPEELTRELPNVSEEGLKNLDEQGIVRIGTYVESGDILVGKVTPRGKTDLTPEERLLRAIFGEKAGDVKNTSLSVPPGIEGVVIGATVFSKQRTITTQRKKLQDAIKLKKIEHARKVKQIKRLFEKKLHELLVGKKAAEIISITTGEKVIEPGSKISEKALSRINIFDVSPKSVWTDDEETNKLIKKLQRQVDEYIAYRETKLAGEIEKVIRGDELPPGVIASVNVFVAMKRKISVGDKIAGRHGNKGCISKIVPVEDMPYLEDGTPVDIILNPLGVPSRMNIGQILETHLGWAASELGLFIETPVFNGATIAEIKQLLRKAKLPESGKTILYSGKTGEPFDKPVVVGTMYVMKLAHMAEDKIHARSTGPYALVTQQPLGGKAQKGGQRFGEMEVWALEAYGAAYALQEILTYKSDDIVGRTRVYEAIVKGENIPEPGMPASFNVLLKELRSLCLDVKLIKTDEE
ncbi:MAG: DNA-directed RNA polymerase subunit beta [candidate division Zixibacteria bacterium 4484_93]|nr:MAG: DNA-directed RNA polymerase subunit beta [candidate division Zixibacteria bacterium 4484_93]